MSIYKIHSPTSQIIYTVTLHPTQQKTRISLRHNTHTWNGTFANTKETATLVQIIQGHAPRNVEASIDVIDDEILGMPKEENKRYIILTIQGGGIPRYNHQVNAGPHKTFTEARCRTHYPFPMIYDSANTPHQVPKPHKAQARDLHTHFLSDKENDAPNDQYHEYEAGLDSVKRLKEENMELLREVCIIAWLSACETKFLDRFIA